MPDTGYQMPDTGYRMPDTGYRMPDTGYWRLGYDKGRLISGCRSAQWPFLRIAAN